MAYLEEILLKILECREKQMPLDSIAEALNLAPQTVEGYETSLKESLVSAGRRSFTKAVQKLQLSPIAFTRLRAFYEDNNIVNQIKSLAQQGKTRTEIAKELNLSYASIACRVRNKSIDIPHANSIKYSENVTKIKSLAQQGKTRAEIAKELNLHYRVISHYIYKKKIEVTRQKKLCRPDHVKEEIRKGTRLLLIANELKLSGTYLYGYLKREGLSSDQPPLSELEIKALQDSISLMNETNRKVLQGVLEGKRETDISKDLGKTREYARQQIIGLGLYATWEFKRKTESPNLRSSLVGILRARINSLLNSPELSWAEKKAYEYNLSSQLGTSNRAIPHERLVKLFSLYEQDRRNEESHPLGWFAEKIGYEFNNGSLIRQAFSRAGINLKRVRDFEHLSEEKILSLKKAANLGISMADVAYFSGLPYKTVEKNVPLQIRTRKGESAIHYFTQFNRLTYKLASQIFQAHDLCFSSDETTLVCETLPEVVAYAEQNRQVIEPRIIKVIKTIYPREDVKKPYLDFDGRRGRYK